MHPAQAALAFVLTAALLGGVFLALYAALEFIESWRRNHCPICGKPVREGEGELAPHARILAIPRIDPVRAPSMTPHTNEHRRFVPTHYACLGIAPPTVSQKDICGRLQSGNRAEVLAALRSVDGLMCRGEPCLWAHAPLHVVADGPDESNARIARDILARMDEHIERKRDR